MGKKVLAVYDVDPFYADRFADFVNRKEQVPFAVMAFTTLERLKEFAAGHGIELLLISGAVAKEELEEIPAGQVVVLEDGAGADEKSLYPRVYKFQSTDNIIREVMACYCQKPMEEPLALLGSSSSIVGVYSPVNRCLKTSFALTMGQLMAKDSKVLYLNLEDCSGLSRLLGEEYRGDLSDILYFYRQGSYNWAKLSSVTYSWGDLDYIPPVRYPEDLIQVSPGDMAQLLARIARESTYEVVVVDFGQYGKAAAEVLEVCDVVYMPVKEDLVSMAKVEEFEEYLEVSGRSKLKERIRRLKLPYHSGLGRKDNYMEQLLWGELGDYARELLRGGKPWKTH